MSVSPLSPLYDAQTRPRRHTMWDGMLIAGIVALSSVPYLAGLGFYSDDWAVWGLVSTSEDPSFLGAFRAMYTPQLRMRPVQFLYQAGLHEAFGLHPLGYHLVNTLVLAAGAVLFYLALRELEEPRALCLAVPLVYATLPHYSTDRLWVAAFQATLSMTLYFACLYAELRAGRSRSRPRWGWKLTALSALLLSVLAYEMFIPLFLLVPVIVGYAAWRKERGLSWRVLVSLFAPYVAVLVLVAVFKAAVTTRGDFEELELLEHLRWFAWLVWASAQVGFVEYGVELPVRLWQIGLARPDTGAVVVGGLCGMLTLLALIRATEAPVPVSGFRRRAGGYGLAGMAIFLAGLSIFLTNRNAIVTATGIANRIAIASAIGVALVFSAVALGTSSLFRSAAWRRWSFSVLAALLVASGSVVISSIASYWVDAYRREGQVLRAIRQHFPDLPEGSTLLLDGVCPYVGPAIVFESYWDLQGALILHYGDPTLRADVISETTRAHGHGISTAIYRSMISNYPYGENLYVYDYRHDASHQLHDAEAARLYLARRAAGPSCPEGSAGSGVPIF